MGRQDQGITRPSPSRVTSLLLRELGGGRQAGNIGIVSKRCLKLDRQRVVWLRQGLGNGMGRGG